jgi:hypothetical protein
MEFWGCGPGCLGKEAVDDDFGEELEMSMTKKI